MATELETVQVARDKKFNKPMVKRHKEATIIMPDGMSFKKGKEWLDLIEAEEESPIAINHELVGFPLDGAVAFWNAVVEVCGFASPVPTMTMFGPKMPQLISVPTGPDDDDFVQVPIGEMTSPAWEGKLNAVLNIGEDVQYPSFIISGTIKKKSQPIVQRIIKRATELLREHSIYRGKAIRIDFGHIRDERPFDFRGDSPKFIDTRKIKPNEIVFSAATQSAIDIGLFSLIKHTAWCRKQKIPLKSGLLAAGPYGTGKSLLAYVTAKVCVDAPEPWTFLYVQDVRDMAHAMKVAAQYQPCVLFGEDVDRATEGERDADMDEILNVVDGVGTKSSEIIVIFTTNHVDRINPAMIRPGRIDTLIEVTPPDADAAIRLVKLYGRNNLSDKIDWALIGVTLDGMIPASICTVVEKSKRAAMLRDPEQPEMVETEDIIRSADAMKNHLALVNRKHVIESDDILAARAMGTAISQPIADAIENVADDIRIGSVALTANGK